MSSASTPRSFPHVPMRQPISRGDDFVSFRCLDPDGYDIEVYWEPPPA